MQCCRIPAFARDQGGGVWGDAPTLTYLDYICKEYHALALSRLFTHFVIKLGFLLSEVDKSTPMAIDYWQVLFTLDVPLPVKA